MTATCSQWLDRAVQKFNVTTTTQTRENVCALPMEDVLATVTTSSGLKIVRALASFDRILSKLYATDAESKNKYFWTHC